MIDWEYAAGRRVHIETVETMDAYAYLDMLRAQRGAHKPGFNALSEFLEAKARRQGVPIHGQFELTPLCNLRCRMCYVRLAADELRGRRPLDAEQWKDLIRQAFDAGMFQATLTGGECLTYPGFDDVYLYLHSLGCQVDVLTNGVSLDDVRIDFFRKHPPGLVQVTLYGDSEDAYQRVTGRRAFDTVVGNLRRAREAGLPLSISVTPNRALGEDVFETIRLAYMLSENVFINTSLFAPPDDPERLDPSLDPDVEFYARILRFRQQLKGETVEERPLDELPAPGSSCTACAQGLECGGGRSGFLIDWKGEMRICNRLAPTSYPLRDGFAEAWRRIHDVAEHWPRAAECRDCAYEAVCVRCAAEAQRFAEPGQCPKGLCERTRYMVSRGVIPFTCPEDA